MIRRARAIRGDCYPSAFKFLERFRTRYPQSFVPIYLCHGIVTGTGGTARGVDYGHAWVELGDHVVNTQTGHQGAVAREVYYSVGNVRDVTRYTLEQAQAKIMEHEHYGPWTS